MEVAAPILVVVVLGLLIVAAVMRSARRQGERTEELRRAEHESDLEMLRYHVPQGHDPAVVLAALHREGFEAIPDTEDAHRNDILIPCQEGADRHREHVRAVIGDVDRINFEGDRAPVGAVRFADE